MKNLAVHFSSASDNWSTPQDFFDKLNAEFGPFDLDVCANPENAKCLNFASKDGLYIQEAGSGGHSPGLYCGNGLFIRWSLFKRCWMNPPYGDPEHPCKPNCKKKKCLPPDEEQPNRRGHHITEYIPGIIDWIKKAYEESQKGCLVVCLLPARTDTKWFHEYIQGKAEIRFVKGRLKFGGAKNSAPFPSMVVIFRPEAA